MNWPDALEGLAKLPVELVKAGAILPAVGFTSVGMSLNIVERAGKVFPEDVLYLPLRWAALALMLIGLCAIANYVFSKLERI